MVSLGGIATFAGVNILTGNEKFYKQYVMPIVHSLDPERAHRLAVLAGKYRLFPRSRVPDNELLVSGGEFVLFVTEQRKRLCCVVIIFF